MRTPTYSRYLKGGLSLLERMMRGWFGGGKAKRFADRSPELKAQLLDSAQEKRLRRARSRLHQAEQGGMMIHVPVEKKRRRSRHA